MKAIPGHDGYFADEEGNVYSGKRRTLKKLAHRLGSHGRYYVVNLQEKKTPVTHTVHKLVLLTFVGAKPPNHEARHLNGNCFDNRIENLKWGTRIENDEDKKRHGATGKGKPGPLAKLDAASVREIREMHQSGIGYRRLSKRFGVSPTSIRFICDRRSYAYVQ